MTLEQIIFVGIACRSKKDKLLFSNALLDYVSLYFSFSWDGNGKASLWVGPQRYHSDAGPEREKLIDGGWIKKMGGGAKGVDKLE